MGIIDVYISQYLDYFIWKETDFNVERINLNQFLLVFKKVVSHIEFVISHIYVHYLHTLVIDHSRASDGKIWDLTHSKCK